MQSIHYGVAKTGIFQYQRYFVNVFHGCQRNNGVYGNVAEGGDFFSDAIRHIEVASAENSIRLDTDGPQFLHAVLGWLGFQLPCGGEIWKQGQVDVEHIVPADFVSHLPDGFKKWQTLNVANGTPYLDYYHVNVGILA